MFWSLGLTQPHIDVYNTVCSELSLVFMYGELRHLKNLSHLKMSKANNFEYFHLYTIFFNEQMCMG